MSYGNYDTGGIGPFFSENDADRKAQKRSDKIARENKRKVEKATRNRPKKRR